MDVAFRRALRSERARWGNAEWVRKPASPRIASGLRWVLLIAACVVPLWMVTTEPSRIRTSNAASDRVMPNTLAMTSPSLTGAFADGRRYQIVATTAAMQSPDSPIIALQDVRAAMQTEEGGRLDITAKQGQFNRIENRIALEGDVVANRSDGYEVRSQTADIWDANGEIAAKTRTETDISGPEGAATSAALDARPGLRSIQLVGPVKVRLSGAGQ
jgi:LPS export ABC transporter protein LptC